MKPFPIPVVAGTYGPGSQPEDEPLNYIASPGTMSIFRAPAPRIARSHQAMAAARELLTDFLGQMDECDWQGAGPRLSLLNRDSEVVAEVNEMLGEGEVSARIAGNTTIRIQETAFAGVWRILGHDGSGRLVQDEVEAGRIPQNIVAALNAQPAHAAAVAGTPSPDAGVMSAPPILSELHAASAAWQTGHPAHVINLTLLPVTEADLGYLGAALGTGPVSILSRGYGDCHLTSTALPHTWWVQYFNSVGTLILDTLEVTEVPEAALAAPEDLRQSVLRLREWLKAGREIAS